MFDIIETFMKKKTKVNRLIPIFFVQKLYILEDLKPVKSAKKNMNACWMKVYIVLKEKELNYKGAIIWTIMLANNS